MVLFKLLVSFNDKLNAFITNYDTVVWQILILNFPLQTQRKNYNGKDFGFTRIYPFSTQNKYIFDTYFDKIFDEE